jgi:glycolate oxidase iron-sulfur subunit
MSFEQSIDRCVRCGFCLPACPTYRLTNDEVSSPRGRIALAKGLIDGDIQPTSASLATFSQCVGCRACESACPSGVIYEEVLLYGREAVAREGEHLPWHARALLFAIRRPERLKLLRRLWQLGGAAAIRLAQLAPVNHPAVRLPAALPRPTPGTSATHGRAEVVIHRGCLMDVFWGRTNTRAAALLDRTGLAATLLSLDAGCCGALHAHQGDRETARQLARRVIQSFENSGARTFVNLAGGCSAFITSYPDLFEETDPWHGRAHALAAGVRDIASLLSERGYDPGPATGERTTYQDSCHLRHGLQVWREPRALLEATSVYGEMPSADQCCGSAGIYNLIHPDIAGRMLGDKVNEIRALRPDVIVTANPGCELQWRLGVREAGLPIRVQHLVDYLFERQPFTGSDVDRPAMTTTKMRDGG